jgi:hypothetical protein
MPMPHSIVQYHQSQPSYSCHVDYFLLRIGSLRNLYAYLFLSVRKPYQVPQGKKS